MIQITYVASLQSFYTAYNDSDFFGKLIFLGLLFLSVLCWWVLTYKVWFLRKMKKSSQVFQNMIDQQKEYLLQFELPPSENESSQLDLDPFRLLFVAVQKKTKELLHKNLFFLTKTSKEKDVYLSQSDLELIESHALTTISVQNKILEKNLFVLTTIMTLAPFLGLLGTVWGILTTFTGLQSGGNLTSSTMILGGLATALTTTVLGLVIAIPALVAYNYLKNSVKVMTSDMEDFLYSLLSTLELQYRKVE